MPWPTDPIRRAETMVRFKAAQQSRWTEEARRQASERATAQFSDPAHRQRMSEIKRQQFVDDPTLARRISETMRGVKRPATIARIQSMRESWARRRNGKAKRLALIRNRAVLVFANGKTEQATTSISAAQ
jgi:hypothetical protein